MDPANLLADLVPFLRRRGWTHLPSGQCTSSPLATGHWTLRQYSYAVRMASSFDDVSAAWAAARRAIGTRYGEQLT